MSCHRPNLADRTEIVVRGKHTDDCPGPDQCNGCQPCGKPPARHCSVCTRHLDTTELGTCIDCLAQARRNLIAIVELAALLPDHALQGSRSSNGSGHLAAADPIPGGDALVLMSRGSEGLQDDVGLIDADPPAWILGWWDEEIRTRLGLELNTPLPAWQYHRPATTLVQSQKFLHTQLAWAAANHPGFHTLADDLTRTRRHLEELLHAGELPAEGVACFTCGHTLERDYRPPTPCTCGPRPNPPHIRNHANRDVCCLGCAAIMRWELGHLATYDVDEHGDEILVSPGCDQGGLEHDDPYSDWHCPRCKRKYSPGEYQLAVKARHDQVAEYRLLEDAIRITGAKRGSIQGWASKGAVRRRRDGSGRTTYNLADIRSRLAGNGGASGNA